MSDYIKREKALEIVKRTCGDYASAFSEISKIQPEDVAPVVRGKWEPTKYPFMSECVDCSKCGYRTITGHGFNYCPRCGAKMYLQEVSHG